MVILQHYSVFIYSTVAGRKYEINLIIISTIPIFVLYRYSAHL